MSAWLVDTGSLVAFLDKDDKHHARAKSAFAMPAAVMWTTVPVITETMYFLRESPEAYSALLELMRKTKMRIEPISDIEELEECVALMTKYRDVPMDFADGSVVFLAEKVSVLSVLTTDERGFRVFRTARNKWFHLVLDDFPG